ncbi:hypothetical protein Hanom_Chr16g01462961 [Helianthus anomalus]
MPYTVEESIRADTMTYDPKIDETSIKNETVKEQTDQPITFNSPSVNDTNVVSSCVDKVTDVTGEDTESANEKNELVEPSYSKCESSEAADSEKLESVDSNGFRSKPELSDPTKADEVKNDVDKASSTQSKKFEPTACDKRGQSKQKKSKRDNHRRGNEKTQHQR